MLVNLKILHRYTSLSAPSTLKYINKPVFVASLYIHIVKGTNRWRILETRKTTRQHLVQTDFPMRTTVTDNDKRIGSFLNIAYLFLQLSICFCVGVGCSGFLFGFPNEAGVLDTKIFSNIFDQWLDVDVVEMSENGIWLCTKLDATSQGPGGLESCEFLKDVNFSWTLSK